MAASCCHGSRDIFEDPKRMGVGVGWQSPERAGCLAAVQGSVKTSVARRSAHPADCKSVRLAWNTWRHLVQCFLDVENIWT